MTMPFSQTTKSLTVSSGGVLSAQCLTYDMQWKVSTFDLFKYIGNVNGDLTWGSHDFHRSSDGFRFEGTKLFAKCKHHDGKIKESWLDLSTKLRCDNGVIVAIEFDEKLSTVLSQVPWMRFKVVAEPDFSAIMQHTVIQATMDKIAKSTVEHVTAQMSSIITLAVAAAIETVTHSAYEHISQSMEVMLHGVAMDAHVHRSVSAGSKLREFSEETLLHKAGNGNGNGVLHSH